MKLNVKQLAISAVTYSLLASGQAFAHTSTIGGSLPENTQSDVQLSIGHGCEQSNGAIKPVIAQSVVFPLAAIEAATAEGKLDGFRIDTIQNKDIFGTQAEKFTAAGNLYAFSGRGGPGLSTEQRGRLPFQVNSPDIDTLDGNCISEVHVQMAVADICVTTSPKIRSGKLNLWAPAIAGSAIIAQAQANSVEGVGEGPELVFVNTNYNAESCGPPSEATILELAPTAPEIDNGLDINGYWMAP